MGFAATRDAETLILFADVPAPASFKRARIASIVIAAALSVVLLVWLGAAVHALRKLARARTENRRQAATKQTFRELIAFLVCCLSLNVLVIFNLEVRMGWYACSVMGMIPSIVYSMMRFYGYRVLLMRAKTVEAIMPAWLKVLERLVRLGTYGVFVIIAMVVVAFAGALTFQEGTCTPTVGALPPLLGAVLDTLLSGSLLVVFVVPVLQHSRRESKSTSAASAPGANKLRHMAIRNLVLSTFSIGTSVFFMIASVLLRVPEDSQDMSMQHRRLFPCYGGALDSFGNATIFVLMYRKLLFPRSVVYQVHPSGPSGEATSAQQ